MVVSMTGIDPSEIDPVLSYHHKSMEREWVYDEKTGKNKLVERNISEPKPLYGVVGDAVVFQQGLLQSVLKFLDSKGLKYEYNNIGNVDCEPDYENLRKAMPGLEFRTNQDLVVALVTALPCGQIIASAAFGKTFCITVLCALYPDKKILIASPGADLVKDTHRRLSEAFPKEKIGQLGAGGKDIGRITVSTYNSLCKYLDSPDIVLVDESHRAACDMVTNPLSRFIRVSKIFGFTASPKGRSDGAEKVIESLVGPIILDIPYKESASQGVVAEMTVLLVDVLSGPDQKPFKQAVTKQRNLLWRNLYRNKVIANAVEVYSGEDNVLGLKDPQVLILVGTTVHLENLSKLLPDYELVYKTPGKSKNLPQMSEKEREEIFKRFQNREIKKVIATSCWGTGVDFPDLDLIVYASGKSSPIDVIQHTGRATRKGTGNKIRGYVIDFKDQWCNWAKWRSIQRQGIYKTMGWKIIEN